MKLKLDENIPASFKAELAAAGHDVRTVVDEDLVGNPDERIWTRCQLEGRFLITKTWTFLTRESSSQGGMLACC